jgi:hypothetical protein
MTWLVPTTTSATSRARKPLHTTSKIGQQVVTVGDLDRSRSASVSTLGVAAAAITTDTLGCRVIVQPGRELVGRAAVEQIDGAMPLDVDQYATVHTPTAHGELVHPRTRAADTGGWVRSRTRRSKVSRLLSKPRRIAAFLGVSPAFATDQMLVQSPQHERRGAESIGLLASCVGGYRRLVANATAAVSWRGTVWARHAARRGYDGRAGL